MSFSDRIAWFIVFLYYASGTEALKFIGKLDVFATAYLGFSMDFNCTTDDPTASVALLHNQGSGPLTERPLNPNKLILNGQVFTVLNIAISDGGQYVCRATDQSGTTITSSRLYRVLQRGELRHSEFRFTLSELQRSVCISIAYRKEYSLSDCRKAIIYLPIFHWTFASVSAVQ